ncbi:hypothetical protein MTR67_000168 [Solanum verrucosum]|uniref:Receptor-like protein 12 n=1 Tax=Solanum verrucosum TaxID=315347 RepID=A0AAF0PL36_SOLVR|nr:hypothetical protein MTR67_000168 [Solanum verrucosum]
MKLYLYNVDFTGRIPESFSHLTSLLDLDMRDSNLSGPIPKPLWNLTHIESLLLGHDHLEGQLSQFLIFEKLKELSLRNNNFDDRLEFLSFNRSWTKLEILDFHSNSLTGPIPSNGSGLQNLEWLYLSSNHLNGTVPSWIFSLPSLTLLDLSNNTFSGKIQEFKSKTLLLLDLRSNNISGQIDSAICNLKTLFLLDLRSNNLEGTIPQCLGEMSAVEILDLSNNSLSGTINTTFSIGNQLNIIKLNGNKLQGKVPPSLINCEKLEFLDLSNNELNDTFPKWLGDLPHLYILNLRTNKFYGPIRTDNLFAQIRVIDLSSNGFSGVLPVSLFQNFQAMKTIGENSGTREYVADIYYYYYKNSLIVTTKGLDHELPRVLTTQIIIDLSMNRFEGRIPSIIGDLIGLRVLNLSHNVLEGHIPASLQNLSMLESLDLSSNKISGEIPHQLASLTFLAVLNLSHNHLVGCIPKGKQFDTFENSSYQGNDGLRGLPLSKHCSGDDRVPQETIPVELDQEEEEEDSPMISWQAILMGYGFGLVIGLSVIYIMLSAQYPAWFSRMVVELEHRITTRMKKHKKSPNHNFELLLKNLTQLRELNLDSVNISSTIPLNFSSYLTTLRLPYTELRGVLPERVFHLSKLEFLDLSSNPQLTVRFPTTKWNSSASLMKLRLRSMNFTGRIPESFSHLTSLHELNMGYSNLSGPIPKSLWNLTHIESLFLDGNHLEGPNSQFSIFEKLKTLSLGNNNFDGQLEFLSFNRSWTQLEWLDFSSNSLAGPIPSNVSGLLNLQSLCLSSNHLNGTIPSWIFSLPSLIVLDLSNNTFKSNTLSEVDLSQNQLEGPLSFLNQETSLTYLLLSHNNISGQIASTICNLKELTLLNLRNNNLEGTIPQCLGEMNEYLWNLDLSNNSLSGTININFSIGNSFRVISLHGNKLTGKVPRSLINCKQLTLLDLGNNQLNDTFPNWLGYLPDLKILSLRSNKFHGPIKHSGNRNLFLQLQILDLSSNGFSGNLPISLFGNLQAMKKIDESTRTPTYVSDIYAAYYDYLTTITTKGQDYNYVRILDSNMTIDLSKNRFEGHIPNIIGDLVGLRTLNLSHNVLEGHIPASLQYLSELESLDLSSNKISGEINMTFSIENQLNILKFES